jgi:hypothetical protein
VAIPSFSVGEKLLASDAQELSDAVTSFGDSTPGTAKTGFTVTLDSVLTFCDGKIVDLTLRVTNASAITATSGNIPDTDIYVLNAAYRPVSFFPVPFSTGAVGGMAIIDSDGSVTLQTASDSIAASSSIQIHAMYALA